MFIVNFAPSSLHLRPCLRTTYGDEIILNFASEHYLKKHLYFIYTHNTYTHLHTLLHTVYRCVDSSQFNTYKETPWYYNWVFPKYRFYTYWIDHCNVYQCCPKLLWHKHHDRFCFVHATFPLRDQFHGLSCRNIRTHVQHQSSAFHFGVRQRTNTLVIKQME